MFFTSWCFLRTRRCAASRICRCCCRKRLQLRLTAPRLPHQRRSWSRRRRPRQREQDSLRDALSWAPVFDVGLSSGDRATAHDHGIASGPSEVLGRPHRHLARCHSDKFLVQLDRHAGRPAMHFDDRYRRPARWRVRFRLRSRCTGAERQRRGSEEAHA
jgi:hypothetical protein